MTAAMFAELPTNTVRLLHTLGIQHHGSSHPESDQQHSSETSHKRPMYEKQMHENI